MSSTPIRNPPNAMPRTPGKPKSKHAGAETSMKNNAYKLEFNDNNPDGYRRCDTMTNTFSYSRWTHFHVMVQVEILLDKYKKKKKTLHMETARSSRIRLADFSREP